MEYYVGLDVSLKQTSICVVDQTGSVVREGVVDSDPEAISVYVRSKAPDAVRIGLETGPTSTWLWTELKRLGLPVICIDARHAKAVLKMQINKSDGNDAIGIARIKQTGWFKEVHVKDIDSHSVRALLASRALLVKIKRDLENHVRGVAPTLRHAPSLPGHTRARRHAGCDRDDDQRGARFRARLSRATTLYSVGPRTRTMMQSYASAAKLRSGGPILLFGIESQGNTSGLRPPRTVIGDLVISGDRGRNCWVSFSDLRSLCRPQNDAVRDHALPHETPQGDQ
jgi:hypothetical protein